MASLDVTSLFTRVPVDETINLLLDRIYRDHDTPQLNIPERSPRRLLQICTKEAPSVINEAICGNRLMALPWVQLCVLFANTYMGFVEWSVFQRIPQPTTYSRYTDDIFVIPMMREALDLLRQTFVECSVLRFTCEFPQENNLPFLDVRVTQNQEQFTTSVYRKPTNISCV